MPHKFPDAVFLDDQFSRTGSYRRESGEHGQRPTHSPNQSARAQSTSRPTEFLSLRHNSPPDDLEEPGVGKPNEGATSFRTIHVAERPRDFTLHLRLPINKNFDDRLDVFSQLVRMGDFVKADRYFKEQLEDDLNHPYVFVQYTAMLLKRGDYKSIKQLNAEVVFATDGMRSRHTPRNLDEFARNDEIDSVRDHEMLARNCRSAPSQRRELNQAEAGQSCGLDLLYCNWKLIQALSTYHLHGTLNEAIKEAESTVRNVALDGEVCSTEIHIVVLTFQICGLFKSCNETYLNLYGALENWFDGAELYESLLAPGRIWDFTDLFKTSCTVFGLRKTLAIYARGVDVGTVMEQWTLEHNDESTTLAQLDMLSCALAQISYGPRSAEDCRVAFTKATGYAESVKTHHPQRMKSAPFVRWLLAKAIYTGLNLNEKWFSDHVETYISHLSDFPGLQVWPRYWSEPMYYIPRLSENPGRPIPSTPAEANRAIVAAVEAAKQLGDYETLAYGLNILIAWATDPIIPINELLELEKHTQGDEESYMLTLLMSYLTCSNLGDQKRLLNQLGDIPKWTDPEEIRSHRPHLARDFIQRALELRLERADKPIQLNSVDMLYLRGLEPRSQGFAMLYNDDQVSSHLDYPSTHRNVHDDPHDHCPRVQRPTGTGEAEEWYQHNSDLPVGTTTPLAEETSGRQRGTGMSEADKEVEAADIEAMLKARREKVEAQRANIQRGHFHEEYRRT